MSNSFDFAVIGAGPGGVDAALRARELGLKTALIEKKDAGGTCLNTGCIPTKALLACSRLFSQTQHFSEYGIQTGASAADYPTMLARKNKIVDSLRASLLRQIEKSGIHWIQGEARLAGKGEIRVNGKDTVHARSILIATGSEPADLPGIPIDGKNILSSSQILALADLPKSLLILGAGAVGVEFTSLFHALGVRVTLIEQMPRILPGEDPDCAKRLETFLSRAGVSILTERKITSLSSGTKVEAKLDNGEVVAADKALIAVGRKRVSENLGLDAAGVRTKKNGAIEVNEYLETSAPGIFAIGDVIESPQLAHVASYEGVLVAENLAGKKTKVDYAAIPSCVYSDPEVASVGVRPWENESEIVSVRIPFAAVAKAQVEGETEGFFKLFAWKKSGKAAGCAAVGAHVTELLSEVALAVRLGLPVRDLSRTVHAHPTRAEVIQMASRELLKCLPT